MTFWQRYARGLIWLSIVIIAFAVAFALSGCVGSREQPPCPDCYLMVPQGDARHE